MSNKLNVNIKSVIVPVLDIDKQLHRGETMLPRSRIERRVVANLIAHLEKAGFALATVFDGDEENKVTTMKEAMELVFNLDDCWINFARTPKSSYRGVRIVLGNDGYDCISDWKYSTADSDGFNKAMEAFDPEQFV